jgi:hypothetical protein
MIIITNDTLEAINDKKISLDMFFILYNKAFGQNFTSYYKPDTSIYQSMVDRGLLQKSRNISKKGRMFMEEIYNYIDGRKDVSDKFDEFWDKFPKTDEQGLFSKTRSLREGKPTCRLKFDQIVRSGYKPDDIIRGLENEIEYRKKSSHKENKFKYMRGSVKWLELRIFENWLDDGPKTTEFIKLT